MSDRIDARARTITIEVTIPTAGQARGWLMSRPRALWATLAEWQRRASSRSQLARLDERMLRDMGFTREMVAREAAKPFWRS